MAWCAAAQPQFEAASVKPAAPQGRGVGMRGGPGTDDPGRIVYTNVSFKPLVAAAYGMKFYQVSGFPEWTETQRFDVMATLPAGTTKDEFRQMQQKLLADRFQLVVHRETKEMALYRLVVARGGPKLKPLTPPKDQPFDPTNGPARDRDGYPVLGSETSMAMVAGGDGPHARAQAYQKPIDNLIQLLAGQTGAPVVDATGLKGEYDYTLSWIPTPPGTGPSDSASDVGPDLFAALREQLGLQLEHAKGQVEILVIDRANKTPVEN